ncbi:MAG: hypothetical protein HZY79_14230 [Rhodoblastus sp.]|nr:MAG: hypothetical protein HZY79_14230 [Rhodoblastus sp.]
MTRGADECRGTSVTSRFDVVSFGVAHECVLSRAAIEISYPFETSGPATIDLSVAACPLIVGSDEDAYAYHPALTTQWLCAPPDWPATRDVRELEQVFESFVWPNQANSCRPPPGESDIGCLYFNGYEGFDVLTISCLHRGNFQFELRLRASPNWVRR